MKINKNRFLAGAMALLIGCSTLFNAGVTVSAAEISDGVTVETSIQETTVETEGMAEELPELSDVLDMLDADEIVTAEDIVLTVGDVFDEESDLTGIIFDDSKVKVTFKDAEDQNGQKFDSSVAGTYHAVYCVEPTSGHPSYQITRRIIVNETEAETQGQQDQSGNDNTKEDGSDEDGEADPDPEAEEIIEEMMEDGVFLSVVPATTALMTARSTSQSVSLHKGDPLYYPSDLGSYLTCQFTVNGKVAYCIESNKTSPPSADYVANIYESNLNLQKVLYYGYGGPGDLTGTYLKQYDTSVRYILTHLAASYAYTGESVAFTGCYESGIQKYGVREYISYLFGQDAPPTAAISLSPTTTKAYEDGGVQRTEVFKLTGDTRNYVTLTLPKNVTYHSGSTTKTGSVKIYGGTSFYFSAPMTVTGTWKSGTLSGQIGSQWKTLVVSTGNGDQDIGYGDFYEEANGSVNFTVTWMELAKVKVTKKDDATGVNLAGAVFGIYSDKGCTNLITKMPETDAQGATEVQIPKTQSTVYLKEISVPQGYKLNTSSFNVALVAGETTSVAVTNQEQKGKITVRKNGEVLKGVTGTEGNLNFVYENASYAGAKYTVYAAEDIYSQDKVTKIHNAGDVVTQLETGTDGSSTTAELYLGTYKIVEQQAPYGLVIGKTAEERTQNVTLTYAGQTVELATGEASYTNARPDISVKVVKRSANDDVTLEGAVFGLYAESDISSYDGNVIVSKGTLIEQAVSDVDGNAVFKADIPLGFQYSVQEIQAPDLYYMSDAVYNFTYEYKDDSTYKYTFENEFKNEEVRGEIHVNKIDKDSQDFISQGDAKMVGAKYGLYAAEDIQYPNKKSGTVYRKDQLVAQGQISGEGTIDFTDLYLGSYYVKELEPAEGYLLDETAYPVTVDYEGQEVKIVHRYVTVKETVKKQAFQLIKISEDGEQTETDLVEGAGFKVFLISSLAGVKDGNLKPGNGSTYSADDFIGYDYSGDETASYYENGKKVNVPELFTDSTGYLSSPELPYGEYVVFESTTPENLKNVNPFIVHITEDSREPQVWRVFDDRPLQFYFKIVKKDAQTQEIVLNNSASYKIYDVDAGEYVEMIVRYPKKETVSVFQTNEEGYLITPEQLKCGTYRIEEVQAPSSYVVAGFENALVSDGIEIPLNEVTAGGEYQSAGKAAITITVDSNTVHQVEEETGKFIVVVEQYNDEAVGSLTLNKQGEKLKEAVKVEDQFLSKVKNSVASVVNAVSEFITGEEAMDISSGYEFSYEMGGIKGAEFAVYAKETIYTPDGQTDAEGNRIVRYNENDLVATLITGTDGKAVLNNLPIGKYYLVEEKAGQNCILDTEAKEFEIKYNGQEVAVDYVTMDLVNERQHITVEILKKDAVTGEPLEGVTFGLYAEEDILNADDEVIVEKDSLIEAGKTDAEGKLAFQADLPHGLYYVKEIEHKPGYLPNEEIYHLDASYTDSSIEVIELSCEIENQPTITEFTKTDLIGGQEVEGAKLQILKDGEVVEEWVSGKEPHTVYALEPGEYVLHEEQAPTEKGYVRAEDVAFVVEETGEVQKVEMQDDHTKVSISKTDITTGEEIEGAKLQILDEEGNVVEEWISGEEHLIEYLPTGTYTLHEEQAPTEKGYVRAEDVTFVVEETGEIQEVEMQDDHTKVSISKTDITDGEEIQGAKLQIIDEEGNVVEEWTTGEEHLIEYLPTGTYTLHEEAAIDGYVVAEDVEFTVLETGEIQKVEMKDVRVMGVLKIHKTNAETGEALEGVEFTLYEKESGKEAAVLVTDKDGNAETEQLPIGIYENGEFKETTVYVLKETKPLEGYEESEEEWEITFEYQDDQTPVIEVAKEIQNKKAPVVTTDTPKTGDDTNWMLPLLGILAGGICVAYAVYRKKKMKKGTAKKA